MQISFSKQGKVTIMHIIGDVDSSTYTDVIKKSQEAYDEGVRDLLLDMEKVPYVSSAGLMALHSVARIYAGHSLSNPDGGRPIFRAINPREDGSAREHVKLMALQPAVSQVLDVVGLGMFFEVYGDLESALSSFK
ncbi:MAG TPA: STAS domain-containing protein [Anaerolineales bacterium]|nr:STAS domain-containing protein [Anaerolineales bacterium]HNC07294.1 STAS domain-containing protein [Anaerolineales bacterium]